MIVSCSAKSGVTNGVCTVRITATAAASAPESTTASPITWLALTPSMRAVRKSAAAARVRSPIVGAAEQQRERAERAERDEHRDDRHLAHVDAGDRDRPG